MAGESFENDTTRTLNGAINNSVTTLTASSAAPTALQTGNSRWRIDDELTLLTAGGSGTSWTITRGIEGTTAASHADGATISHVFTAASSKLLPAIGMRAFNSANISLSAGAWTNITLDSENYDTDGIHSTSSNTARATVPAGMAGLWAFDGAIEFASGGNGTIRGIRFFLNATTVIGLVQLPGTIEIVLTLAAKYRLAAGDYVVMDGFQDGSGALNAEFNSGISPVFSATFLGS